MKRKILIVDDEKDVRTTIETALKLENYMVKSAASGEAAITLLEEENFDLVITDMRMPGKDGVDVLRRVKGIDDTVEVIILTGYATIENAIETLRNDGAYDYLTKPLENIDTLLLSVAQALEHRTLRNMNRKLTADLQQTKKRYELAARAGQVSVWDWNTETDEIFIDPGLKRMLGYEAHEIDNRIDEWIKFVHPDDVEKILNIAKQHPGCESKTYEISHRMIHKAGDTLWFLARGTVLIDEGGKACRMIGTHTNITERVCAETALQESEARYRSFMNQFNGIAFRCSLSGGVEFVNGSVEAITGYTETDFVDRRIPFKQIVHPEDFSSIAQSSKRLRTVPHYATTREYRIVHKDGYVRWIKEYIQNVCDSTGSPETIQAIIYDHTDRKAMEEKLQQDQIFKAIASLAGGVAHEFNNALVGITGNLELMVMEMADETPYTTYLKSIKSSAHRMSALTNQLLAYARGGKYQAQNVTIDQFIENALPLTMHAINPTVRLETDVPSGCASIECDPIQLQMMLSALLANASEAMNGTGRIRLEARNTVIDEQSKDAPKTLTDGLYVCLSVKDEGKGMDANTRRRIFEPFFTTKMQGRGLGMAAVYGIVKNHGGGINIDSEPSRGTTVSVYLPATESTTKSVEKKVASPDLIHGDSTILIVDDEPMVLEVGRLILKKLGYRVLTCAAGKEALEMIRSKASEINLVLLDIKLPDMNGADVLKVIKDQYSGLKVVICSGYALIDSDQDFLATAADDFIQKPFSMSELSAMVGRLLTS